jgi:hypothetical protein
MNKKELEERKKKNNLSKKERAKLSLREMVNSIWCYFHYDSLESYLNNKYILNYSKVGTFRSIEEVLTLEEIKEIVIDQLAYLNANCKIKENVYTDSEDVTYNSIVEI